MGENGTVPRQENLKIEDTNGHIHMERCLEKTFLKKNAN